MGNVVTEEEARKDALLLLPNGRHTYTLTFFPDYNQAHGTYFDWRAIGKCPLVLVL